MRPFHLAFPVLDLEATKKFYSEVFGCKIGRESERWVDFDLYGHQITAHQVDVMPLVQTNVVDGDDIPSSHFGVILKMADYSELEKKLVALKTKFLVVPHIRFEGEVGEQYTMFFQDPSGNALEFKAFTSDNLIFQK